MKNTQPWDRRRSLFLTQLAARFSVVRRPAVALLLAFLCSTLLLACGGAPDPTATPAPTATMPPATPTATSAPAAAVAVALPATAVLTAADGATVTPALPATPTVSVPVVVEEVGCQIESDLDLGGYPDLRQKMGCALADAQYEPVAINEFGTGPDYNRFMLWFSDDSQIYVLFPDQTWQAYVDNWAEGQPEITCNPFDALPSSPPLPRRGFGKLWCTVTGLQSQLGTIDREERLCQHTVVQRFEQGRLLACFEDATIRYFRLLDDGSWDLSVVQ